MAIKDNNRGTLLLKFAFMLATSWTILAAFVQQIETVLKMNPVAESTAAHDLYEAGILIAILSAASYACMVAYKRWPTFLQVHHDVSCTAVLWRLVAFAPVIFSVIGLVVFALAWLFVVRLEDPADPQYGLSAWWAGGYYALMLTPMITVVGVWQLLRRNYPN